MESLTILLYFVIELQNSLENGENLNRALKKYTLKHQNEFSIWIKVWLFNKKNGISNTNHENLLKNPHKKAVVYILERGIEGLSILSTLKSIQIEVEEELELEINKHISSLPFKLLIPIFIFQFPAYMVLLLGPILSNLTRSLSL